MSLPETMSAVLLTGHGGPEVLEWRDDVPVPVPGPRDVLVKVGAAGVNNTDINTRLAWYSKGDGDADDASWSGTPLQFPRIQGADICGTVVAGGSEVDSDLVGKRVLVEPCLQEVDGEIKDPAWYIGSETDGGFAQYVKVASRHACPVDSDLTDVELASFPCSYTTSENMLTRANVGPGDTVLVTGASGGVGSATVQLARARGAEVVAVTSASKAQSLLDLGATQTLDRDADVLKTLGRNTVDVVVDLVGGPGWPALLDVLKPKGRYAVAGAIAGPIVDLDLRTLYLKDLSFFGCTVLEPEVFGNLVKRIERKEIKPLVAATYPLKDIAAAQEAFGQKGYTGKIVLTL
jgi:NADPH:quinone reductase-like Zn-dependent oxidoreductase